MSMPANPTAPRVRYRALVPLFYPTDPDIVRRLQEGEAIRWDDRHHKEAAPGEIVDDIPLVSIPILLEKGWIEIVKEAKSG